MSDTRYLDWPFFEARHRELARDLDAWAAAHVAHEHDPDVDAACKSLVQSLGASGWLHHAVREVVDTRSICLIRETLARHSGLADFAFAMQGLGSGAIVLAGTPEQKARYLPRVAAGQVIAAFALSEPEAGSDVAALACRARSDGESYVLDGEKMWISNGGIADFYVVFARTGEAGSRGISAFVVDADTAGFEIAERIEVIAPHPLARLRFTGCRIPAARRLGAEGEGFKLAMRTLDIFRTSVAAAALGFARRALAESMTRVTARRMFGGALADLQLTQARLAHMATTIDTAALLTYRAAWVRDQGRTVTREAAMAKLAATEGAQQVIDGAVQLMGALGVVSGQPVERLYREIRALRIYEGATEVQQLIIARDLLREHREECAVTTAHRDTFARDHLPPREQQPEYLFDLPELQFPPRLNCATELLDRRVAAGHGNDLCLQAPGGVRWTYGDLLDRANRVAHVLVDEMGLVPGNRVLLRSPNNPMLAACWFAVMKAGGIAVATMPLLRAKELAVIIDKGRITHALCDARLADDLRQAAVRAPQLARVRYFNGPASSDLEAAMAGQSPAFQNVDTAADDTCIFAFTSGTTGVPKATMHFHRDMMAICACFPPHVLRPRADDVFIGSPPMGFTFGLGGLLLFPMSVGASTVLLERPAPDALVDGIGSFGATILFTAPTSYRAMAARGPEVRASKLRRCVSAGEVLPAATRKLWKDSTGIELIDGIGATELLHIFISADEANAKPGATGKAVPGYQARVVDADGRPLPPNTVGRLAVKGPTGCRYLADDRQSNYVKDGWNYTGDAYLVDDDGYFHFQSRTDDMIISAGYNIASPEVEDALLLHPKVAECGVIGVPDEERGQIVKAFVVLRPGATPGLEMCRELQDFVKDTVAPYKYPRAIEFIDALPRTETGKLQRFKLRAQSERPS